jgi:hypothetical protein
VVDREESYELGVEEVEGSSTIKNKSISAKARSEEVKKLGIGDRGVMIAFCLLKLMISRI